MAKRSGSGVTRAEQRLFAEAMRGASNEAAVQMELLQLVDALHRVAKVLVLLVEMAPRPRRRRRRVRARRARPALRAVKSA